MAKLSGKLYKWARKVNDLEKYLTLDPTVIARRRYNKMKGRITGNKIFSRK